jgi:hypothetical protein
VLSHVFWDYGDLAHWMRKRRIVHKMAAQLSGVVDSFDKQEIKQCHIVHFLARKWTKKWVSGAKNHALCIFWHEKAL